MIDSALIQLRLSPESTQLRVTSGRTALDVGVGSLGVRGLIEAPSELLEDFYRDLGAEGLRQFIRAGLVELGERNVRRVHMIVPPDSALEMVASSMGFTRPPGEVLHEMNLRENRTIPPLFHPYTLREGRQADIHRLNSLLQQSPELAFQGWEVPLIAQGIGDRTRFFKIIECDGEIVGLSIGGASGQRGTISHLWVHRHQRHKDLGTVLCNASLESLYQAGSRVVHLMTVSGNEGARKFWERQGFEVSKNVFCERDL